MVGSQFAHVCPASRLVSLMNDLVAQLPMMEAPTPEQAAQAVQQARRLFSRTLASWAVDCLQLRHAHLDSPQWLGARSAGLGRAA